MEPAAIPESPAFDVAVIIVNFNGGENLAHCLGCLARQTLPPARIIVVDNASVDSSGVNAQRASERNPALKARIEFVFHPQNIGFAAANNRAASTCNTEFIALLNPDAFPGSDWLEKLAAATERHPQAAAFGSRQMMHAEDDVVDGSGDVYHFSGVAWRRSHGKPLRPRDLVEQEIFSVCAAAALYRRAEFLAAGGFDEEFFCYFEDVDLGFRLRLEGQSIFHVPDAVVHHVGSASSGHRSDFAVYHGHRNMVWCFIKNMPGPLLPVLIVAHLLQTAVGLLICLLRGQCVIFLRAKRDALARLGVMFGKRRSIQARRRLTTGQVWRLFAKAPLRL